MAQRTFQPLLNTSSTTPLAKLVLPIPGKPLKKIFSPFIINPSKSWTFSSLPNNFVKFGIEPYPFPVLDRDSNSNDSALVRQILSSKLNEFDDIEVVATAADPYIARDKIVTLVPDVMTLDIEMPRMDGVEFLTKLIPQYPLATIVLSSLADKGSELALNALDAGALDFLTKPSQGLSQDMPVMIDELAAKIRSAAKVKKSMIRSKRRTDDEIKKIKKEKFLKGSTDKVIAIGASTGGTEAIRSILENLPVDMPGIVITQHMPPVMTKKFADRLDKLCSLQVKEAVDGDKILGGRALIAPGGKHMSVYRSGGEYSVKVKIGQPVNGHMPSVEVLFDSVAEDVGSNAIGIMLTGMGKDGALAMKRMHDAGSQNIIQDEASSVVWGMPGEAFKAGAAKRVEPLDAISTKLIRLSKKI